VNVIDPWDSDQPYEPFMGRWSRAAAALFLDWLDQPAGLRWLDVGCGTGALSALIARQARPRRLLGIDPSAAFIAHAARTVGRAGRTIGPASHLQFKVAGAESIPAGDDHFDIAVSALALNFFPDPIAGLVEMRRVVRPGRPVALYVWDYAEGMAMLRTFWAAVVALDPAAGPLDEAVRFPICRPDALERAFKAAGLQTEEVVALDVPTPFADFDDYWRPFLGGVGPAPGYVAGLDPGQRAELAAHLREALPTRPDGSIALTARAWAVRGLA
jgi:SAM-dependent methyltransferase